MEEKVKDNFLKLYEPLHDNLFRYCRAISGNIEDAEDLLQDTIITTVESFDKIKNLTSFKSYLFGVASNLHKMRLRRKKFHAEFRDNELAQIIDHDQNQETITEFRMVYEQIMELPQKMSEALILFHISDLTLEDIQKIQGGSLSGVKLRLKRGREKLLSKLNTPQQVKIAMYLFTL